MTTAEKITAGIALLGALGIGALLKSWVDHLLSRPEKRVNIADRSVQVAEIVMTRMESEFARMEGELTRVEGDLKRAQEALAEAQAESEALRLAVAERDRRAVDPADKAVEVALAKSLTATEHGIDMLRTSLDGMRFEVFQAKRIGHMPDISGARNWDAIEKWLSDPPSRDPRKRDDPDESGGAVPAPRPQP